MISTATWFGPRQRPLFGFLHYPDDGRVRAGVVLCPPVGYEYVCSHRTFRELADTLAAHDFLVLRFDYDGTGDSAGDDYDPGRVQAWQSSVGHAEAFLRSAGVSSVAMVGMRMGATLAGSASEKFHSAILWDPVVSGTGFLREARALQGVALGLGAPDVGETGSFDVPGVHFAAETVADLEQLHLQQPVVEGSTLVLVRGDRPRRRLDRLVAGWSAVTLQEVEGQDRLLDHVSSTAEVPRAALTTIVTWLDQEMPTERFPMRVDPVTEATMTSARGSFGERVVQLGPLQLFGIVCESKAVAGRPTIVLLNNAFDHHIGPARMWVDWGREMALAGWRMVRIDGTGIGDSPGRAGAPEDRSFAPYLVADIAEACRDLGGDDGVVFIGLCSGGLNALGVAQLLPARGVVAVNSALHLPLRFLYQISGGAWPPELLRINNARVRGRLNQLVPGVAWRVLNGLGRGPETPRLLQSLAAQNVDVLMAYGAEEFDLWKARQSMRWILDGLSRKSQLAIWKIPNMDHALMRSGPRQQLAQQLTSHLTKTFTRSEAPLSLAGAPNP